MAISAPQDSRPPEETNNPGQTNIDNLVDKEYNPDEYRRRHEEAAGDPTDPRGNDTAAGDPSDPRSQVKKQEESPDSDEKSYYKKTPTQTNKTRGFWRGPSSGSRWRRKRTGITAAVLAASAAASVAIFLALLPLKILHIVNNLEGRFYATGQNALQNETDSLLKRYIVQHVLPSYKSCGTTVSKNCSVNITGSNPVSNMYRSWANARIENKLATNYGIEFKHDSSGWYLKTPRTSSDGVSIGKEGEKLDSAFEKAGISDVRKAVKDETRWYQVYLRFKVGRLLEEKYGIRRCLIVCSLTDPLAQKVADQKIAAKLLLTQRVLTPRTQTIGYAMECLLLGDKCTGTDYKPTDATPGETGAEAGAMEDINTDTPIRENLAKLATLDPIVDKAALDELEATYNKIAEKGYQNYLIEEGLAKLPLISAAAAETATDKIPLIGWINLADQLIIASDHASGIIKKMSYITNAYAAVQLYSMYRTYADEIKTGKVNATEVGSLTDSLGKGDKNSVGGTATAEQAPLYAELIDGHAAPASTATSVGSSLLSYLVPGALAATTGSATNNTPYTCNNGQPPPKGQSVCDEEHYGGGNQYANAIHDFLHGPGSFLYDIASAWHATIGTVFGWANDVFGPIINAAISAANLTCHIPFSEYVSPWCGLKKLADGELPKIQSAVASHLFPSPYSDNMSGGRTFDMMAGGADVSGNDTAHITLGGQQLSDQQVAIIRSEQNKDALQQYNNEPFFARLKDTNSPYSPISRFAMTMPTSWSSAQQSFASVFSSPLHNLGHIFSIIFSPTKALAATAQPDPFGVVQYGYPSGAIPSDPEAYWSQNCSDNAAYAYRKTNDWNTASVQSLDQNEMPLNTTTNPCLLIMATTGSAGGLFDSSLLTQDDLSN